MTSENYNKNNEILETVDISSNSSDNDQNQRDVINNRTEDFVFSVIPSPPDNRDHVFEHRTRSLTRSSRSNIKLPKKLDLRKLLNFSRNQGKRGTCAAFSACAIKEYHERLDVNYQGYLSPNSVYYYRSNKPNSGMFLRDVMKILYQQGIAHESDFPYDQIEEPNQIPLEAVNRMKDYRIKEYARVSTINGLKEALYTNGPCIIAFPVYDGKPEFWRALSSDSVVSGGHAVAVVGYDDKGFILRNSWGKTWNMDGCVHYPYDEWGSEWECWTSVDDDSPHQFKDESKLIKILRFLNCTN